jgi:hypothetical protein
MKNGASSRICVDLCGLQSRHIAPYVFEACDLEGLALIKCEPDMRTAGSL